MSKQQDLSFCEICDKLLWDNNEIDEEYHFIDETIIACCECFDKEYFQCDSCNGTVRKENIKTIDYDQYCLDCYNEIKEMIKNV